MLMRKPSATARQASKLKAEIERDLMDFDRLADVHRAETARETQRDDKGN